MIDVDVDQSGQLDDSQIQMQETRPKKTRNRLPVSCEPCRIRRAKCDRERPYCGACSKRGEMEKCLYQTKGPKHGAKPEDGGARIPVAETEDRLRHLENMITQVVQSGRVEALNPGYQAAPPNGYPMQPSPMAPAGDSMDGSPDPVQLSTIVADLQELRSLITGDNMSGAPADIYEESTVLLGASTTPSLEFILHQYLPERHEVESYLAKYFRSPYIAIPVIHSITFQRELELFWEARHNADPIWTGLLFTLLSLSAHITSFAASDISQAIDRFITAAAQCLNLGGYTRPKKHLIPALLLLAQSQYLRRLDPSREVRMVLAMVTQLAFQSGLHREPPQGLSSFEAEMRRRHWLGVRHFEIQVACQFGVPSVIPYNAYDVSPPRNLHDEDMQEGMTKLPEERDWSEPTVVTSFLIKSRLMTVLNEVLHHALSVRKDTSDNSEETISRLDFAIRHEHASIPTKYAIRAISESYTDSEALIMSRLTLEFLVQKTLCILHRRRMAEGHDYSRRTCMDAACKIIKETTDLVTEFGAGRQMQGKSYILNSTIINDFLLGSMILCMGVATEDKAGSRRRTSTDQERLRKQIDLLTKARDLCADLTPRSRGAKRVGEAISLLYSRLHSNASIDPALPTPFAGIGVPSSIPLSANLNVNGMPPTSTSYSAYLPTPAPSSTMSQERSTSAGSSGPAAFAQQAQRHANAFSQQQQQQLALQGGGGYDYAANIAAAASAAPLPTTTTSTQTGYDPNAAAAASAALFQASGMAAQHLHAQNNDPVQRYMMDASGGEEIDWTAFDQYIFNESVRGGGGWGSASGF